MAIFVVAHEKGGVGKTTLTFNLTGFFSGFIPTKVIDLDSNRMFSALNELRQITGIQPFDVIEINSLSDQEFVDLLNEYTESADKLLIIDSGGFDSAANSRVAGVADFILTPAGNTYVEIIGLKKYQDVLDRIRTAKQRLDMGDDKLPCYVVFNRVHPNTKNYIESDLGRFLASSEHYTLLSSVIKDRRSFNTALIDGGYTVLERGSYDAKKEILDLGVEISNILFAKLEGKNNG